MLIQKPLYKINKPVRLITLFSGYDSQALSLKYLGIPFEHYKTCEWAIPSINALHNLHFDDNYDYSQVADREQIIKYLCDKGISANYNTPVSKKSIYKFDDDKLKSIYNSIRAANNLVSITQISGRDLGIYNTNEYEYILTYSFPCQDLSTVGAGRGMFEGTGTRSSLLWDVKRLLLETPNLPQILLMENVPQVINPELARWIDFLSSLGYISKYAVLNATDYGSPQNRVRCFMVSILGGYYEFPKPIKNTVDYTQFIHHSVNKEYYIDDISCYA